MNSNRAGYLYVSRRGYSYFVAASLGTLTLLLAYRYLLYSFMYCILLLIVWGNWQIRLIVDCFDCYDYLEMFLFTTLLIEVQSKRLRTVTFFCNFA